MAMEDYMMGQVERNARYRKEQGQERRAREEKKKADAKSQLEFMEKASEHFQRFMLLWITPEATERGITDPELINELMLKVMKGGHAMNTTPAQDTFSRELAEASGIEYEPESNDVMDRIDAMMGVRRDDRREARNDKRNAFTGMFQPPNANGFEAVEAVELVASPAKGNTASSPKGALPSVK